MKKSLTLLLGAAAVCSASAADHSVSRQILDHAVIYPGLAEIDINGDGILDLIYSGEVRDAAVSGRIIEDAEGNETQINNNTFQMVWNPATQSYDISEFPYYFANKPYFAVADWNGDGLTDFYVTGEASMALHNVEFGLFINNGDGTFTRKQITVIDENGDQITPFDPRTVDVADFNSDGRLDMVVTGWKDCGEDFGRRNFNMVLINQGDDKFLATNTELLMYGNNGYELALNLTMATDLNNDGYADFLTQGNIDNADDADKPVKNGKAMGRTFVAALNLGADGLSEGVPVLYDLGLADGVAHHYGHGGFAVCDFNNDGVPDIFVGGESPADARADGAWEYFWQLLSGRITSDGVSYTDVTGSQIFNGRDIRPLNDASPFRAIDYNGNGLYDLLLPGWCTGMIDGTDNTQAGWFFANNNGNFTEGVRMPGGSECAVFFTEDGVSGARNYGILGQSWDNMFFNDDTDIKTGRMMAVSNNPFGVPVRPDAPSAAVAAVDGYDVNLSWSAPAGAQANVTYDYYIKDLGTGKFYRGITAFVGGDKDGVRTTVAQGRAFMAKNLNLVNLPDGDYEWGVQTVNAACVGSVFAKGNNFRIGTGSGAGVVNTVSNSPVVATEYYDVTGRKLDKAPENGMFIEKTVRLDGTVNVSKIAL
ncbi:MAG: VCBS repeat-containing protein [Muribaculaceae bacterium]|nr:VCBS repeat-containing protein [Muribaculaceae bacterium]